MTLKFECDVCGKISETTLDTVSIDEHKENVYPLKFEICKECREKMFELVKKYRAIWFVSIVPLIVGESTK